MVLTDWFKGFEKGIAKLSEEQRETFFRECGRNCVQCGTLQIYKDLYEQAAGDLDRFFAIADEQPGVRCETVEKDAVYNLVNCTSGAMSLHICSVNAQGKASFMSCSRCGKTGVPHSDIDKLHQVSASKCSGTGLRSFQRPSVLRKRSLCHRVPGSCRNCLNTPHPAMPDG